MAKALKIKQHSSSQCEEINCSVDELPLFILSSILGLKNNVWIVIAVLFATAVIFCWSLYGISLWIAIAVAFAGAVILFFCKTQFGINNNSVLAIALVFSGAVITLPGVLYSR